jgi:hypothetical protein
MLGCADRDCGGAIMALTILLAVLTAGLFTAAQRRAKLIKLGPMLRGARGLSKRGRAWLMVSMVAGLLGMQAIIGTPAFADQCGQAPIPERPGAGMVGAIDPPSVDHGGPNTNYGNYSYAGTVWHVYENSCTLSTTITDPNSVIDTWAGNELFNVGKNIVGATNSLHYAMLSQDSMLKPLDNAVEGAAQTFYNNIYVRWFGPVALVLAILLFRYVWTGDLASISKRSMWALAGMWVAASVLALGPVYSEVDSLLLQKTSEIQAGFLPQNQVDAQRHVLPDALYDNVIFANWQRGEFGDPNSPQAKQYSQELLSDQAWTKTETAAADDQAQVTAKQNDFKTLPAKLGSAAGFFQGSEGSRTGDGFLAMFQGFAYSLFQLFAKAAVLLAQVLLRVLMLAAPLIGLAAMVVPEVLPRVAKAAGAVLFNVLLLSALAGMDALLLGLIFNASSQLSLLAQMLLATLVTVVFFMVGKPMRRMWQMVELSVGAAGRGFPAASTIFSRRRKKDEGSTPQDDFWENVRNGGSGDSVIDAATARGRRIRPEATYPESGGTVPAAARRMDLGGRRELTARPGGGPPATVLPAGGPRPIDGPTVTVSERRSSRLVDTPPVVDNSWDRDRGEDAFVVPSKVSRNRDAVPGPRRAETEMVAGRPVFVLYRPSRGLEVRDSGWDSTSARS